jgi:hypothetical protein
MMTPAQQMIPCSGSALPQNAAANDRTLGACQMSPATSSNAFGTLVSY